MKSGTVVVFGQWLVEEPRMRASRTDFHLFHPYLDLGALLRRIAIVVTSRSDISLVIRNLVARAAS